MNTITSWLAILLGTGVLALAVHGGHDLLDRLLGSEPAWLWQPDDSCPCVADPDYHSWAALQIQMDDERLDSEDHR